MTCCIALEIETETYSVSVVDIATVSCLFVDYDTGPPPTKKIYLLVNLQVSLLFA